MAEYCKAWNGYEGSKHSKKFCVVPSRETGQYLLNLSRGDIKRIEEVITYHCFLNDHLLRIGCQESPRYRKEILGKPVLQNKDLRDLKVSSLAEFILSEY